MPSRLSHFFCNLFSVFKKSALFKRCGVTTLSSQLVLLIAMSVIAEESFGAMAIPISSQNSKEGESVDVIIKVKDRYDRVTIYPLSTVENLNKVISEIHRFPENIEVHIRRQSAPDMRLDLKRNSMIIPKNFVKRYYMANGESVVEKSDHLQPFCYYTGRVFDTINTSVSLTLCQGVAGIIHNSRQNMLLKAMVGKRKVWHNLYEQSNEKENRAMRCGNSDNEHFLSSKTRLAREVQPGAGHNISTRYIEMYLVVDEKLYRRSGSVDAAVQRALSMANHVSVLYQKLNIYIAIVGVEVWNNGNKIIFPRARNDLLKYNSSGINGVFLKYRFKEINKRTPNDNAQLLVGVPLEGYTVGLAYLNGMCSRTISVGVTWDHDENNFLYSATVMAHELGHNLGFLHSDSCHCPFEAGRRTCIMNSIVGN